MFVTDASNNVKQNSTILTVALRCRTLDFSKFNYNLTQDAESDATCFTIGASNITLDCRGFEINYSQVSAGFGVDITTKNFTTVRSCNIVQADIASDNTDSHAIQIIRNSTNTTIHNNTIIA